MPRRCLLLVCLVLLFAATPARGEEGAATDPAPLLEALVDLPTAAARRARAEELAAREDVPLEAWLRAMRAFGRFERMPPGWQRVRARIHVGGRPEDVGVSQYVPATYDRLQPVPLLVAFHGSGGDGTYIGRPWQAVADALGMIVVAPHEPRAANGYTGTPAAREAGFEVVRWARRRFNVDERRIYATGTSRGGHLVWDMALRRPDVFAALMPFVGAPRMVLGRGANNVRYLENLRDVAIRDLQGAQDDQRLVENLRVVFGKLDAFGARDARLIEFPDRGHGFDFEAVDWVAFLGEAVRAPVPERVVRRAVKGGPGRAAWVEILETSPKAAENFPIEVPQRTWAALDERGRRVYVADQAEERTARLEATLREPGRVKVRRKLVKRFRLWLTPEMLDEAGRVRVSGARVVGRRPAPSQRVLLEAFAERFDRTFLPTVEVVCR